MKLVDLDIPFDPTIHKSWAAYVTTCGDHGYYSTNQLRFAMKEEADAYGLDLAYRWTLVEDVHSFPSTDPVNYVFGPDGLQRLRQFRIVNVTSGVELGVYTAQDEGDALEAMARDAGYADHAEACRVAPIDEGDLRVEEVQS